MDPTPEMVDAVDEGVMAADAEATNEALARAKEEEKNVVKALWQEYETAREFDKEARAQYAIDRRYAAGTANLDWVVKANLIGAFIDILVSFLYARNPDVSARKAPRVDNTGTSQDDDFARTIELVVSSLWKSPSARLKHNARSMVRSTLSVGVGWVKAIMVSNGTNIPQLQNELNDTRKNLEQIEAVSARLLAQQSQEAAYEALDGYEVAPPAPAMPAPDEDNQYCQMSQEELDVERARLNELQASVQNRLEVAIRKGLAVDFVAAEDMQVSLDVPTICDYTTARWVANAIYRPVDRLQSSFPRLTEADVKKVKCYYQRKTKDLTPLSNAVKLTGIADSSVNPDEAEQYTSSSSSGQGEKNEVAFGKVVELWNRETGHVHTMIEGLDRWAKEPYQPDYPTTRFYPYFLTAFYPVDGARHPQSLSWRLAALQDEYASTRSGLRLTRARAIPGTLFNKSGLSPEDAKAIERSQHQEFVGIAPTDPMQPLRDLFTEKPISVGDMRLFDTAPILADMERISGVQEALQQSSTAPKTATEAEIQQSGFASRTTADRDVLETMLTELAHYTSEVALSALDMKDAQRIAGAKAFWPHGMAIDDLLTLVEVNIEAGTTGKPKSSGDREAWGVVMPMIKEAMLQIYAALLKGDQGMADALIALLQETMNRMGDDTAIDRFIPRPPEMPPGMPGAPGAPGAMPGMPGAAPGMPGEPAPGGASSVDPVTGAPSEPQLEAPQLEAPIV